MSARKSARTIPLITCAWCDKPIGAGPHVRLAHSKAIGSPAAARAYLHVCCSGEIEQLCKRHRLEAAHEPATANSQPAIEGKKPKARAQRGAVGPRISKPQPNPKAALLDDVVPKVRDLATRGFKAQMIAAQLRVPYAAVTAALGGSR